MIVWSEQMTYLLCTIRQEKIFSLLKPLDVSHSWSFGLLSHTLGGLWSLVFKIWLAKACRQTSTLKSCSFLEALVRKQGPLPLLSGSWRNLQQYLFSQWAIISPFFLSSCGRLSSICPPNPLSTPVCPALYPRSLMYMASICYQWMFWQEIREWDGREVRLRYLFPQFCPCWITVGWLHHSTEGRSSSWEDLPWSYLLCVLFGYLKA